MPCDTSLSIPCLDSVLARALLSDVTTLVVSLPPGGTLPIFSGGSESHISATETPESRHISPPPCKGKGSGALSRYVKLGISRLHPRDSQHAQPGRDSTASQHSQHKHETRKSRRGMGSGGNMGRLRELKHGRGLRGGRV